MDRVRPQPLPAQGPQGRRLPARPHARGAVRAHREGRVQLLQGLSGHPVPDPDQVPGRGAAPRRHPARPRVRDEGLLLLRPGRRGPGAVVPDAPRRVRQDLRPARPEVRHRLGDVRRDGRLGVRGVPRRCRRPARTPTCAAPSRTTRRTWRRSSRPRRPRSPSTDKPEAQVHHTPNTPTIETLVDFLNSAGSGPHVHRRRHAEERAAQDPPARRRQSGSCSPSACPATARWT